MVPVDVGPDEARDAAVRELSDPAYHTNDPSLLQRIGEWFLRLLDSLGSVAPGGYTGLAVLVVAAVLVAVIVRLRLGRITRGRRDRPALFDGRVATAEDHRRAAAAALDRGDLTEAVRERFRAIVRELEQRGVLDQVSGRTVDEIAAMAGAALPARAGELAGAAGLFDEVVYGGRPATRDGYQRLVDLDERVRHERPVPIPS